MWSTAFLLRDLTCRCASRRPSCSSLFTLRCHVLCLCLRVSSLSSNCIVVVSESVAKIAVSSTAVLAVSGFGHSGSPFSGSVTVPVNQYTPRCFSSLIAFESVSRVVVLSTQTWPHRLASGKPIASLRCFTNAQSGKIHVTFIVLKLQLATVSRTKI